MQGCFTSRATFGAREITTCNGVIFVITEREKVIRFGRNCSANRLKINTTLQYYFYFDFFPATSERKFVIRHGIAKKGKNAPDTIATIRT